LRRIGRLLYWNLLDAKTGIGIVRPRPNFLTNANLLITLLNQPYPVGKADPMDQRIKDQFVNGGGFPS